MNLNEKLEKCGLKLLRLKENNDINKDYTQLTNTYNHYKNNLNDSYHAIKLDKQMKEKYPTITFLNKEIESNINDNLLTSLKLDKLGILIYLLIKHGQIKNVEDALA